MVDGNQKVYESKNWIYARQISAFRKKNSIQYFPNKNWKKEIKIASKNNLNILEWTINLENILKNPIYNGKIEEIIKLKKYKIKIPSITVDYFMQKPFFKYKEKILKKI